MMADLSDNNTKTSPNTSGSTRFFTTSLSWNFSPSILRQHKTRAKNGWSSQHYSYTLVNQQLDPEKHQSLMETSLPTPTTARVYVNLPDINPY